ncbi:hypothetical protein DE146DRAFT_408836 [Phaeosphaeria sp. MPI-PUGE-AT-0046c]|nr:hypothetical protein DE146DRAFT_408836 [Phaeosphaeria sp. MPI-PUGE-AT-0046c]
MRTSTIPSLANIAATRSQNVIVSFQFVHNARFRKPINKRGIPSGYLSYIEQRLLDTELLAFELLSAIYKSQVPILPQRLSEQEHQTLSDVSTKQPKSSKIEEWKTLPLSTDEERHSWWLKRCDVISRPMQFESNGIAQDMMTPQDTYSPMTAQFEDMQAHSAIPSSAPIMPEAADSTLSWQLSTTTLVPPTDGTNENHGLPRTRADSSSQGSCNVAPFASNEPSRSNHSQSISAERWRKYF